jgi:outer membrane lipoprotein-sorting protein
MRKIWALVVVLVCAVNIAVAADANQLYYALRDKVLKVKDYTADVKIKIDVAYMRIPEVKGKLYFKAPDKMRLERNGGLSVLPKKNISMTLNSLMPPGNVTAIDAGYETIGAKKIRIIKVIPDDETSNIVLTKLWIDEAAMVALKTETSTKDQGTVVMNLEYGAYTTYGLPDRVTVSMDVKEYKLPQGVTMDYNDATEVQKNAKAAKGKKGTIQLTYLKYDINKGLSDAVFLKKSK